MPVIDKKDLHLRAKAVFFPALDLEPSEWPEYLDERCSGDNILRAEVESLLSVVDKARSYYKTPETRTDDEEQVEIDGYRIIGELGAGGMGVVYLAEKEAAGFTTLVAIKLVRDRSNSSSIRRKFGLERRILSGLDHPNIARLIDGGATKNSSPYFVMEYVEGLSLTSYAEKNKLGLSQRIKVFKDVCSAVSYAHKRAVIHRDIKPANILVTGEGVVKLLDFGIAKLFTTEPDQAAPTITRAFTPEFASPEQFTDSPVTTATDVYSLGVVLYRLTTGVRPYEIDGRNWHSAIETVCETDPPKPSSVAKDRALSKNLKGDLDNIILTALRKEPERRYQSVDALADDLRRHFEGLPITATGNSVIYRFRKLVGRNRVAAAIAALTVLIFVGGVAATLWQSYRAGQEKERAERRFTEVRTLANSFMFELNEEIRKGPTRARELVVKRALEYLDRLAAEAQTDRSLQKELAAAYLKVGDIQGSPWEANLGRSGEAFESYSKAREIYEQLYNEDPANVENVRDLARVWQLVGSIQGERTLEYDKSLPLLEKARDLCESMPESSDPTSDIHAVLADVYITIGTASLDKEPKFNAFLKALTMRQARVAADPDNAAEWEALAVTHERLGIWNLNQADRQDPHRLDRRNSLKHYNAAREIYLEKVGPFVEPSRLSSLLARVDIKRMPAMAAVGDLTDMEKTYHDSLAAYQAISDADPVNYEARLNVAQTYYWRCRTLVKLKQAAEAVPACRQALNLFEPLFELDPTNGAVYGHVIRMHKNQRQAYRMLGNLDSAIASETRAFEQNQVWLRHDPSYHYSIYDGGSSANVLGQLYLEKAKKTGGVEDRELAKTWLHRALDLYRQHRDKFDPTWDDTSTRVELEELIKQLN